MKRFFLAICVTAAVALTACGGKKEEAKLDARQWNLSEVVYADSELTETAPWEDVTIAFTDSTRLATGRGGCNRYTMPYELGEEPGTITFGLAAATQMMCLDMTFETRYFKWLKGVTNFKVTADELRLVVPADGVTLVYKPELTPVIE